LMGNMGGSFLLPWHHLRFAGFETTL
jgi:hypothetical protein